MIKRKPWKWQQCLYKHISMRLKVRWQCIDSLSPDLLYALKKAQGGKCAISGMALDFPNDLTEFPAGTTIPLNTGTSPFLARISIYQGWTVSNIVYIARVFEPLYELKEGYAGIMVMLNTRPKDMMIPTKEQILEILAKEVCNENNPPR